jgi:hypothetical protein
MRLLGRTAGPFFVFAGGMHFVIPGAYRRIVPPYLPVAKALVYASGVADVHRLGGRRDAALGRVASSPTDAPIVRARQCRASGLRSSERGSAGRRAPGPQSLNGAAQVPGGAPAGAGSEEPSQLAAVGQLDRPAVPDWPDDHSKGVHCCIHLTLLS